MTLATGARGQAQTRKEERLGDTAKTVAFHQGTEAHGLEILPNKTKLLTSQRAKNRQRKTEIGEMQFEILSPEGKSKVIGADDHNRGPGNHRGATQDPIGSDVLGPRSQNIDKS